MLKKYLVTKQYEKIEDYIKHEIRLHEVCINSLMESNFDNVCDSVINNHRAQIITLKGILRFIEKEKDSNWFGSFSFGRKNFYLYNEK